MASKRYHYQSGYETHIYGWGSLTPHSPSNRHLDGSGYIYRAETCQTAELVG